MVCTQSWTNFITRIGLVISLLFLSILITPSALAGYIEIGGSFSFSESNLGENNLQWTRRWGLNIGYHFWGYSEVEFAMQDALYRTKISGIEDTTFHDEIYSIDWVQSLASRHSPIIPYFKLGVGQLNREASGVYWTGDSPVARYDALSAVLGAGLKIMLTKTVGLRSEGTTYLPGASLAKWKNNFAVTFGVSLFL